MTEEAGVDDLQVLEFIEELFVESFSAFAALT
jgi:hypothetical protein